MDLTGVTSVTSYSQDVKPGSLFVAIAGATSDGHDFIDEVISRGAIAIIGEREIQRKLSVPYTRVPDSRLALAEAAAQFYGNPSHAMKLIGVTGTSGKTTCTYLVESILHAAGFKVGVIGTINFRYGSEGKTKTLVSTHTTPDPVQLQSLLSQMKSEGVTHVVMEVSSHSLKQKRVYGVEFDVTAFTNLSPEHLDFHRDMEDYFASKKLLFTDLFEFARKSGKRPVRAVNIDDSYGYGLAEDLEQTDEDVLTFGMEEEARVSGADLHDNLEGISGTVRAKGKEVVVESSLTGEFNVSNILTAISVGEALGLSPAVIGEGIKRLKGVPGRLERIPNDRGIHVFVDYAHKPDALEKVLKNLQIFREGHRLITVFGCGGDRDRTKRPVMGKLAEKLSDQVIVTSDNPRTEDPDSIIREIVRGMSETSHSIQPDRKQAIFQAIQIAEPGDIVLIAGKGHEDYQIIGTQKYPFDDRKIAKEALNPSS